MVITSLPVVPPEEGPQFRAEIRSTPEHLVCLPHGDLDAVSAPELRTCLALLAQPTSVVIDLAAVPFIDSVGLGALVGGIRRIREAGGSVLVFAPRRSIARVLHTSGFDRLVPVIGSPRGLALKANAGAAHSQVAAHP